MSRYVVINLPIEPIQNRYSVQWDAWFRQAFVRNNIPVIHASGREHEQVPLNPSHFSNPVLTWKWKFQQLYQLVNVIDCRSDIDRFVVFLQDGWMPGTEALEFISKIAGVPIRVCAFWHAGSYLGTDILNEHKCDWWSAASESAWLAIAHTIFMGSEYHKKAVGPFPSIKKKIIVTGCPIDVPLSLSTSKAREPIVIWPHRPSPGKCPELFDRLAAEPRFKDVQFIKTTNVCKTKEEFYQLLRRAKVAVSTAAHETFGISMVEAACSGCHIAVPNSLSYPELFTGDLRYDNYEQLVELVEAHLKEEKPYQYPLQNQYQQKFVTDTICYHLEKAGKET